MSRSSGTVEGEPELSPQCRAILDAHGIDYSLQARGTKEFAKRVAPLLPTIGVMPQGDGKSRHSNAIVVVDKDGNIAAITPRSEERRVGKECVSTCRSRCSPFQ